MGSRSADQNSYEPNAKAPSSRQENSVLIVGGGLAGIAAALELRSHGMSVTLLEARRQLGGRTGSFQDRTTQMRVDYCQHVGMECCKELQWFIDRLDQRSEWRVEETLYFYSAKGKQIPIKALPFPAPLHLCSLLWKWPDLTGIDRFRIGLGLLKLMSLRPSRLSTWKDRSMIDWLRHSYQTDETIRGFWGTILTSALGEKIDRVTLGASHKVLIDGFISNRTAYRLWIPQRPLSELIGEAAFQRMRHDGIRVELESPAAALVWKNGLVTGVRLSDGRIFESNRTLLAVPWHAFARLWDLPQCHEHPYIDKLQKVSSLESSPITGIHTWWDQPWLTTPHAILIDRLCQWIFPGPRTTIPHPSETPLTIPSSPSPVYYQIVISGSRDLPKGDHERVMATIMAELHALFPESRKSNLIASKIVTDPNAVFSTQPGHETGRLECDEFANAHVWIAGDWTNTGWPATMEGAIRSGRKAASSVVRQSSFAKESPFGSTVPR